MWRITNKDGKRVPILVNIVAALNASEARVRFATPLLVEQNIKDARRLS